MSTKKKIGISDLLRDEVQKGAENSIVIDSTEQTIEIKAENITEVMRQPATSSIEKVQSVNNDTKAKIVALESAIEQSQKRETELLMTVSDLQKDLQISQTNVELLQRSLSAIEQVKNGLDQQLVEVKRDSLRLAEANIQLSEQIKALETPKTQAVTDSSSSQLVSQNPQDPQNNNRATPRKQPVEQPYPHRDRNIYARPTGSNEQLQRINNRNIGWMD